MVAVIVGAVIVSEQDSSCQFASVNFENDSSVAVFVNEQKDKFEVIKDHCSVRGSPHKLTERAVHAFAEKREDKLAFMGRSDVNDSDISASRASHGPAAEDCSLSLAGHDFRSIRSGYRSGNFLVQFLLEGRAQVFCRLIASRVLEEVSIVLSGHAVSLGIHD